MGRIAIACCMIFIAFPMVGGAEITQQKTSKSVDRLFLLTPGEFVRASQSILNDKDTAISTPLRRQIRDHAVRMLMTESGAESGDNELVSRLIDLAGIRLARADRGRLVVDMLRRSGSGFKADYQGLVGQMGILRQLDVLPSERAQVVTRWIDSHDVDLLDATQLGQLLVWLQVPVGHKIEATWTGTIRADESGEFTFSTLPHDATASLKDSPTSSTPRQAMSVSIGGQTVLSAETGSWTYESRPVKLRRGAATPIRVSYTLAGSGSTLAEASPAAVLFWQRSGQRKTVVPASAFQASGRSGRGLRAEYRIGDLPAQRREAANIDQAWFFGSGSRSSQETKLGQLFAARVMAPDFLDSRRGKPSLLGDPRLTQYLNTTERRLLLRELVGRSDLLKTLSWQSIAGCYCCLRSGSPGDAVDLLGKWGLLHPEIRPAFSRDFTRINGRPFWNLAAALSWQSPEHSERLRQRYLETRDGDCVLPVAYLLAYSYQAGESLDDWHEFLDARLSNKRLTGDRRVGWLIARARAAELATQRATGNRIDREQIVAGQQWLEEALATATTETARLRALRETVVRVAALEKFAEAESHIDTYRANLVGRDALAQLAKWTGEITRLRAELEQEKLQQAEATIDSHRQTLQDRLARAQQRADKAAVTRYQRLISELGSSP